MPTRRRTVAGLVLAWVVVVAVVGGLAFVVVSHAGGEVGQASALRTVARVAPTVSSTAAPEPTPTESATEEPTGDADDPGAATPGPSAPDDAPEPPDDPGGTSGGDQPRPSSTPTRTRSFSTAGGTVVVSCTGSRLGVRSIVVRDGWRFEDEREAGRLELHFQRVGDAESESEADEVEVRVGCVGGVPTRYADDDG